MSRRHPVGSFGCRRGQRIGGSFPERGRSWVKALVVIDMLNAFVTRNNAKPRAERIIPTIQDLVRKARDEPEDWLVV
jgi:hypothetical protein